MDECGKVVGEDSYLTSGKSTEDMNGIYNTVSDMGMEEMAEEGLFEEDVSGEGLAEEDLFEEDVSGKDLPEAGLLEESGLEESYEDGESEEIVQLSAEDSEMIKALYKKYYRILMSYACKACENRMAAEDLVQDTFHFAMRREGLAKLKKSKNPGGWLMRVLQYKFKEYGRRVLKRDYQDIEDYTQMLATVESRYGIAELEMVLDKVFTPHEWMLFNMYFIERRSAKEMAEIEGITETNFKVRMCRLRQRIVEEFK